MDILINDEIDKKLWNGFVKNRIFFRYEWLNIIKNSYNLEPLFILIYEDDKYALIPSFKTKSGYISLPFVSYSGYSYNDFGMLDKLKDYLISQNITIDSRDLVLSPNTKSGYVNPIAKFEDLDDFWHKIKPKLRNQLRKSKRYGYSFKKTTSLEEFYDIYSLGMRNLGTPAHKISFFIQMFLNLPVEIFMIYHSGKPIGTMFCLKDYNTLSSLYSYVLPEYKKKYANYFLYLNVIEWMIKQKIKYFDMGRSLYGDGTFQFKKKFNPTIFSIKSNINYQTNKKMQIASEIWKKLPLALTNKISPKIRVYLP